MDVSHRRHAGAKHALGRPETFRFFLGICGRLVRRFRDRLGLGTLVGVSCSARRLLLLEPSYQVKNVRFFAKTRWWLWMWVGIERLSRHLPQDADFVFFPGMIMHSGTRICGTCPNPSSVHLDTGDFDRWLSRGCLQLTAGVLSS